MIINGEEVRIWTEVVAAMAMLKAAFII